MRVASESVMTKDNLPDNMIHLGGDQFLVVRSYQGQTRIHIRKFIEDEHKQLYPTKDGVSLTPRVWVALTEKLPKVLSKRYYERYPNSHVEVVERDLCVFKDINNTEDGIEVMLQRMFQRRDRSFQLVPETIHLNEQQCYVLLSSSNRVKDDVEVSILTNTLRHHIEKLLLNQASSETQTYKAQNYHTGLAETLESLRECFLQLLKLKITELAPCYGCDEVPCTCHSLEELLNTYFESALYAIDYFELAKYFVEQNVQHPYFYNLIMHHNFFSSINIPSFLSQVKNMYAPTEEMLYEELEYC